MLAIIDYASGNQTSVARALTHLDIPWKITADPGEIGQAKGIIFPGVGAASQAMAHLRENGIDKALQAAVERGQPLLGICLGCQILLQESEEGPTRTLGILPGLCRRFGKGLVEENGLPIQVPHMGWNRIFKHRDAPIFDGIPEDAEYYFVHGYYAEPEERLRLASTRYGLEFCSVYGRDGLWAVQFHPEKSGEPGLRMLRNFYNWCSRRQ